MGLKLAILADYFSSNYKSKSIFLYFTFCRSIIFRSHLTSFLVNAKIESTYMNFNSLILPFKCHIFQPLLYKFIVFRNVTCCPTESEEFEYRITQLQGPFDIQPEIPAPLTSSGKTGIFERNTIFLLFFWSIKNVDHAVSFLWEPCF